MDVNTILTCLTRYDRDVVVLTNIFEDLLTFPLCDDGIYSLDIIKNKFAEITGIRDWLVYFRQCGTFENFVNNTRTVSIVYTAYFPKQFHIVDPSYKWTSLDECSEASLPIIRYVLGRGVN